MKKTETKTKLEILLGQSVRRQVTVTNYTDESYDVRELIRNSWAPASLRDEACERADARRRGICAQAGDVAFAWLSGSDAEIDATAPAVQAYLLALRDEAASYEY